MSSVIEPTFTDTDVNIGLNAVIVAVSEAEPRVLVVRGATSSQLSTRFPKRATLPSGPFRPTDHRTLEIGLRSWVEAQTRETLGYVEQLYTFGDRGRDAREIDGGPRFLSVGYLALAREAVRLDTDDAVWQDWYRFFPWEDWRNGFPHVLSDNILPGLATWAGEGRVASEQSERQQRINIAFCDDAKSWNDELVLERYELLYEAGIVAEALIDRGDSIKPTEFSRYPGETMMHDHRRILATGMGRLRGKIKYRPVIFELMPPSFTLLQLQHAVEGMAGLRLHKQNFRRLVEARGLVERTGATASGTQGRPAALFRFRSEVLLERLALMSNLPAKQGLG
jgi:hypothetical protein